MVCSSGTAYTVQVGDTLYLIADRLLGNGNRWAEIKNPDDSSPDPAGLQPDRELCIPGFVVPPPSGSGFASIVSSQTYEAMFPNRNALYAYDSLVAAAQKYPQFCNEG